jgi:hypothetical protein
MKKSLMIGVLYCILALCATPPDQFPQAEITNGIIHARLYLPMQRMDTIAVHDLIGQG